MAQHLWEWVKGSEDPVMVICVKCGEQWELSQVTSIGHKLVCYGRRQMKLRRAETIETNFVKEENTIEGQDTTQKNLWDKANE